MSILKFRNQILKSFENYPLSVSMPNRKTILLDEKSFTLPDMIKNSRGLLHRLNLKKEYMEHWDELSDDSNRRDFWNFVYARQFNALESAEKNRIKNMAVRSGFILLIDAKDKNLSTNMYLYNANTKELSDTPWHILIKKEKDLANSLFSNIIQCEFMFHPHKPRLEIVDSKHKEFKDTEYWIYNIYQPPKWRKVKYDENAVHNCPIRIKLFLEHLFPDAECLQFVQKWLYFAFQHRNETYLLLNAGKGVGKGIFQSLASALVGAQNYAIPSSGFLSKEFNAIMRNKRLLILDEIKMNRDNIDKLKRYINGRISIEAKGIEASSQEENFCSFIISSNNMTDALIECDDRRFAVLDVTKKHLLEVFTEREITDFVADLEDPNSTDVVEYAHYLTKQFGHLSIKNNIHDVYRGRRFWELVYASLTEWQKIIVDDYTNTDIESKSVSDYYSTKMRNRGLKFPLNVSKVEDFLVNYRHNGLHNIAAIEAGNIVFNRIDDRDAPIFEDEQTARLKMLIDLV